MQTLAHIGEIGLLKRIKQRFKTTWPHVVCGIGDDAAVFTKLIPHAVVTTDMLIEHVDFSLDWASFKDIGHKAAAVNLSDLAAMGATPRGLVVALALRPTMLVRDVLDLLSSLHALGVLFDAPLVGGDISKIDGPLVVSVTAIGTVSKRNMLQRYQAQVDDTIYVSGALGGAAAGLRLLQAGITTPRALISRQLRPMPQLKLAGLLAKNHYVRACADMSDGLIKDVLHLVPPKYGAEINVAALPCVHPLAKPFVLSGGEDFELVFAAAPAHHKRIMALSKRADALITPVGRVVKQPGVHLLNHTGSNYPVGYDHFLS